MPRVPGERYPVKEAWDFIYQGFLKDDAIKAYTFQSVAKEYSIVREPLDKETIVFSDNDYSLGICYFLQKDIQQNNGMDITIPTFEIDVATQHEEYFEATCNLEMFATDVQYTVELMQNAGGFAHFRTVQQIPRGAYRNNQMFVLMATLIYSVQIHGRYR